MPSITQVSDDVGRSSPKWIDYADYSGGVDYSDYADYAHESVSAYWSQTYEPDPSPAGSSIQHLPEAGDLLTEKEDIQNAQDYQGDYAISVINRNQRNQSMPPPIRTGDHLEQPSSKWIDYSDYTDYGDGSEYAHSSNERIPGYWSLTFEPDPLPIDASLHYLSGAGVLLTIEGRQTERTRSPS
jgi:hypothetical protein